MQHHYEFAAPDGAFHVRSALDLAEAINLYAGAWPWRALPAAKAADIDIASDDGWSSRLRLATAPQLQRTADSPLESAGTLLDMLTRLCLDRLGPYADLHAGSALIDGRLVVMPGPSLAGKSTLALQLAARGHLLGGDDRLLIGPLDRPGRDAEAIEGLTLGLNARVRLPVHAGAGAAFADYAAARLLHIANLPAEIGFLAPRPGEAAAFARQAPIAAFVLPLRQDGGGVGLEPAASSDIMRQLLEQTHAPHLPAAMVVAAMQALALGRPGYVLRFDDSARAAAAVEALARSGFGDWRK